MKHEWHVTDMFSFWSSQKVNYFLSKYLLFVLNFVSDPPLEEDDIPDGEWLCNECKARPEEVYNELLV